MLKIGDFSKLTQVSVRMLRHYDELGLLKPARTDPETSYRYYAAEQLPRLNRILALQDLGFSLRQVARLLETELSPEQMRGMLLQKQAELADRIDAEQERLARVAARLHQIDMDTSRYDVVVKDIPAQTVAGVRDPIIDHRHIGALFERLFAYLVPLRIHGLSAVIWHDDSFNEANIDAEALVYLTDAIPSGGGVRVYDLPAFRMATVVHHGSYQHLPDAYNALTRWLDTSDYQIVGANRELYLHYTIPSQPDDESYVTEIQFPVQSIRPA